MTSYLRKAIEEGRDEQDKFWVAYRLCGHITCVVANEGALRFHVCVRLEIDRDGFADGCLANEGIQFDRDLEVGSDFEFQGRHWPFSIHLLPHVHNEILQQFEGPFVARPKAIRGHSQCIVVASDLSVDRLLVEDQPWKEIFRKMPL